MPLIIPDNLPAIELLAQENIDIRPTANNGESTNRLRIAILNLMPTKVATETDLLRILSRTPLTLEIHLMKLSSHVPKHTSPEHMAAFYREFGEMRNERFDGMIITGAPVEHLDFPMVGYWQELEEIMNWCRTNVISTMYICWAAQAGLYHHYGIPKHQLPEKMFGIFPQTPLVPGLPLFRGFDDTFPMPHSRHTEIRRQDIERVPQLTIVAESPQSGVSVVMARQGKEIFVTGHSEYSPLTLDAEYRRDLNKGLPIQMPRNYYHNDDMQQGVNVTWRAHGNLLFSNWLYFYVNPETLVFAHEQ